MSEKAWKRDWEKGKGREGKGKKGGGEEGEIEQQRLWQCWEGDRDLVQCWQNCSRGASGLCRALPCSWDEWDEPNEWDVQERAGWGRAWQASLCHHETAVFYPWSLFSHSHSRCVQPTQQTREVNSKLSNQAWQHRDNTACLNSLHMLWHLRRRRNQEEQIETCTLHLYFLATAPCLWTDHPTPSGLGLSADGEVVAALIPGRIGQLASHRGKFLFSSRQIGITFIQAGGTKAAQNPVSWLLKKHQKASISYCPKVIGCLL